MASNPEAEARGVLEHDATELKVSIYHLRRSNAELMAIVRASDGGGGGGGGGDNELLTVIAENNYSLLAKRERLRIVVEQLLRAGWLDDASAFDVDGDELGSSGGASAPAAPAATPPAAAAVAVAVTEAVAVSAAAVLKLGTGSTSSGEGGGGIDL